MRVCLRECVCVCKNYSKLNSTQSVNPLPPRASSNGHSEIYKLGKRDGGVLFRQPSSSPGCVNGRGPHSKVHSEANDKNDSKKCEIKSTLISGGCVIHESADGFFLCAGGKLMKYPMSYKRFHYVRHHLFLSPSLFFPSLPRCQ